MNYHKFRLSLEKITCNTFNPSAPNEEKSFHESFKAMNTIKEKSKLRSQILYSTNVDSHLSIFKTMSL